MINGAYVLITNACNFACTYCYEEKRKGVMSWVTMKQTIDMMLAQYEPTKHCNRTADMNIYLFGGEPFLNWPVMKQTIEYVNTQDVKFGIYILSNGSICNDEILEFLSKYKKIMGCRLTMQISIDGCNMSHNLTRKFCDGRSTFDTVVENIKKFRTVFPQIILRETICPDKIGMLFEDYKAISELSDTVSLTPIIEGDWLPALPEAKIQIGKIFDLYREQLKTRPELFLSLVNQSIKRMCSLPDGSNDFDYKGCHAGDQLVGISTEGEIFPCQRFIAYRDKFDFQFGDVWKGIDKNEKWQYMQRETLINPECDTCISQSCNRCYATNMMMGGSPTTLPTNGYCDFCRMLQGMVNDIAEDVVMSKHSSLEPYTIWKSPKSERRAILMKEDIILSEDQIDLLMQATTKTLQILSEIKDQNRMVINTLKQLVVVLEKTNVPSEA